MISTQHGLTLSNVQPPYLSFAQAQTLRRRWLLLMKKLPDGEAFKGCRRSRNSVNQKRRIIYICLARCKSLWKNMLFFSTTICQLINTFFQKEMRSESVICWKWHMYFYCTQYPVSICTIPIRQVAWVELFPPSLRWYHRFPWGKPATLNGWKGYLNRVGFAFWEELLWNKCEKYIYCCNNTIMIYVLKEIL